MFGNYQTVSNRDFGKIIENLAESVSCQCNVMAKNSLACRFEPKCKMCETQNLLNNKIFNPTFYNKWNYETVKSTKVLLNFTSVKVIATSDG